MIYLDTSVMAAVFFREPGAAGVLGSLGSLRGEGLVQLSPWQTSWDAQLPEA